MDAEASVEIVEISVTELAATPVILGELAVVEVFGGDVVDGLVELHYGLLGGVVFVVSTGAFDVSRSDVFDGEILKIFIF